MKLALLLALALAVRSAAQEMDDDNEDAGHPLTDMPDASSAVEVYSVFEKYPDNRLPLSEDVLLLGGFSNQGKTTLNITSVMGSINSPFDFSFYLMNMTKKDMAIPVPPGMEHSFAYPFQIHPRQRVV